MEKDLESIASLGTEPISDGERAGKDATSEPEYRQIQKEINKFTEPTDWEKVQRLSSTLLSKKTKDLRIAGYLSIALVINRNIDGLLIGTQIYLDLIKNFWDNLYPPKEPIKGRINAINWWIEKLKPFDNKLDFHKLTEEDSGKLLNNLNEISDYLTSHLGDEKPTIESVISTIEEQISIPKNLKTQEGKEDNKKQEKAQNREKQSKDRITIGTNKEADKQITSCLQGIRDAADFLISVDSEKPNSYRLRRMSLWARIEIAPTKTNISDKEEKEITDIPGPSEELIEKLKKMEKNKEWDDLLRVAETTLNRFPYWIDLNRFSYVALSNKGDAFIKAKDVVVFEIINFINRVQGVADKFFSNKTPFSSEITKTWISENNHKGKGSSQKTKEKPDHRIEDAIASVKGKPLKEALKHLQTEMWRSISQKEAYKWHLALASILTRFSQTDLAVPHLEQIIEDIERYNLEQWDPDSAIEGYKVAWIGYNSNPDSSVKNRAIEMLYKIAKLNPEKALMLVNKQRKIDDDN